MSQESVEIVRSIYARWSEGDFRAAVDLFDPYVLLVVPSDFDPESPDAGVYLGGEAIAGYTRAILKPMTNFTLEAEEIAAARESVLVGVRLRGVGTVSGVPTELPYLMLWSFRGRKVIRIASFRERAEALEAAGLSE